MLRIKFQSKKLRIKLYKIGQTLNRKNKTRAGRAYKKNTPVVLRECISETDLLWFLIPAIQCTSICPPFLSVKFRKKEHPFFP
jgi:hypothetical protein